MSVPLISVIVICKNNIDGLRETIDSIIMQSSKNYEIIVVDGGSQDGTKQYLEANTHLFSSWVSELDNGITDAFIKGTAKSKGEIFNYLNSGDLYVNPDVLALVTQCFLDSHFQWAYGFARIVDRQGNIFRNTAIEPFNKFKILNSFGQTICHQAMFISRRAYFEVGGYDIELKYAADFDLIVKLVRLYEPKVMNAILVNYLAFGLGYYILLDRFMEKHRSRVKHLGYGRAEEMLDLFVSLGVVIYLKSRQLFKRHILRKIDIKR